MSVDDPSEAEIRKAHFRFFSRLAVSQSVAAYAPEEKLAGPDQDDIVAVATLISAISARDAALLRYTEQERDQKIRFDAYREGFVYGARHLELDLDSPDCRNLPEGHVSKATLSNQDLRIEWSRGCDDALCARRLEHSVERMVSCDLLGPSIDTTIYIVKRYEKQLSDLKKENESLRQEIKLLTTGGKE